MVPHSDSEDHQAQLGDAIAAMTEVLVAIASGRFDIRVERTFDGGPVDVLSFLVNAMAEEVAVLVGTLEREREALAKARAELVLAEKLAALGELSAGVAHELNQPLTVIRMLTELLPTRPARTVGECAPEIALMSDAARRMARIVDGVQTFARAPALRLALVPVNEPVDAALLLVEASLRDARISVFRDDVVAVHAVVMDADRMCQVFVNILTNARYALESREGALAGTIRIETRDTDASIIYRITDDGPGVEAQNVSRIFDPFFTTKPPGRGTGLGLSVSHGIVREHGGTLRHEAAVPCGATFEVTLPRRRMERV